MFNMLPDFTLTKVQKNNLYTYRLWRLRQAMKKADVGLCILNNPISLRYVIDFDEYQLFQSHIPSCYLYVPIDGPLVMFGATGRNFPHVEDYQRPIFVTVFDGGFDLDRQSKLFTDHVQAFMNEHGLTGMQIGLDRFSPITNQAILAKGLSIVDGEVLVEQAKLIKCAEEILCMQRSVAVAQHGMKQMQEDPWQNAIPEAYKPGMVVHGTVTKITNFGVFVELEDGLEGLLHISELADKKVDNPQDIVKPGEEVNVKILRVDLEDRKIGLSLKRALSGEDVEEDWESHVSKGDTPERGGMDDHGALGTDKIEL